MLIGIAFLLEKMGEQVFEINELINKGKLGR